jgi:hypothetical protein
MNSTYSVPMNDGAAGAAFVKRYADLYRAAKVMTGLGETVKIVGLVAAAIIFMVWFLVAIGAAQGLGGAVVFFMCLVVGGAFGALVGGLFFLLGVLISAQGQLLMSHADSAVHTSPFLSDQQRAAAMSLPFTAAASATAGSSINPQVRQAGGAIV